jgi:hypothetical protein
LGTDRPSIVMFHAEQNLIGAEPAFDGERLDRRLEESGCLLHSRPL